MSVRSALRRFCVLYGLSAFVGIPLIVIFRPFDLYGNVLVKSYLGWSFPALAPASILAAFWESRLPEGVGLWEALRAGLRSARRAVRAGLRRFFRPLAVKILLPIAALVTCPLWLKPLMDAFMSFFPGFLFDKAVSGFLVGSSVGAAWYIFVVYALNRPLFFGVLALDALAVFLCARFFRFPKKRFWRAALFVWIYLCFSQFFFSAFKWGPPSWSCAKLYNQAGVRALLTRAQLKAIPGQERSLPYDSVMTGDGRFLIVSLKRIDAKPGALAKLDIEKRKVVGLLPAGDAAAGVNQFPERLGANQELQEVYAPIFSPGRFRLLAADFSGPGLRERGTVPLLSEPNNVFADVKRRKIIVLHASVSPVAAVVHDMATLKPIHEIRRESDIGDNQYLSFTSDGNWIYLSNISLRDKLYEIDAKSYKIARRKAFFWPFVGIALDETAQKIYLANPLTYSVFEIDRASFKKTGAIPAVGGLADLEIDPDQRRLFVGYYGGTLEIVDLASKKSQKRVKLGGLLRNIYLDRLTHRLFACSGCGVFEIFPGEIQAGR